MGKRAKVISLSVYYPGKTQEEILAAIEERLEEIRGCRPDLVCLPEEPLISGGDKTNPGWAENNRKLLEMCRRFAREVGTNVVVNPEMPSEEYPGKRCNVAYVIDRQGEIIGKYGKRHITFRAIAGDGLPGDRFAVVETDIGRIGLMICFDVGWRDDWKKLADMGAELVVWPSAYHGGDLLNGYAVVHMIHIVTSVWNAPSRVIDPFGHTVAQSAHQDPFVIAEIDVGAPIYHTDRHEPLISQMRKEYGARLSIMLDQNSNTFMLASRDPALTVDEVEKKYGLMTYKAYHEMYTRENDALRAEYPEPPV